MILFPPYPEPLRIEFELTNYCNANCFFCPRNNITSFGYMKKGKFENFLNKLMLFKKNMWLNKKYDMNSPVIVLGGYGEPLLHPDIFSFIEIAKKRNFIVELITNGSLLETETVNQLIKYKLDKLSISLHTLDKRINKKINGLEDVIPKVKNALNILDESDIAIEIWRVCNFDGSNFIENDKKEYDLFLSKYKKEIPVLGPTAAWNRGGQYNSTYYSLVQDSDLIRCQTSFFNWSISYNGDAVLCCCDFSLKTTVLAKEWKIDLLKLQNKLYKIQTQVPNICKRCRKPKDNMFQKLTKQF